MTSPRIEWEKSIAEAISSMPDDYNVAKYSFEENVHNHNECIMNDDKSDNIGFEWNIELDEDERIEMEKSIIEAIKSSQNNYSIENDEMEIISNLDEVLSTVSAADLEYHMPQSFVIGTYTQCRYKTSWDNCYQEMYALYYCVVVGHNDKIATLYSSGDRYCMTHSNGKT